MLEKFGVASQGARPSARGSFISDDLVVDGIISAKGAVEICGRVNGDVEGNEVVVGTQAKVRGDIRGSRIEIIGSVEGDISGSDVFLSHDARVVGAITYRDLTVQSGATMNGQMRHDASALPAPVAQPKGSPSP